MSHEEYPKWLIKIGCGWLGWSLDELRYAHLAEVHLAFEGKVEMLKACFGAGDSDESQDTRSNFRRISSVEDFDRMFK